MARPADRLLAVLCLGLCYAAVGGTGRSLLQATSNQRSVTAGFKNVFAQGSDNQVDQAVNVKVPDSSVDATSPEAIDELTAEDFTALTLDPYNPSCTLSDPEEYLHFSISENKLIRTKGREVRSVGV